MALNLKFNSIFACSNMIPEEASIVNYVSAFTEKQKKLIYTAPRDFFEVELEMASVILLNFLAYDLASFYL